MNKSAIGDIPPPDTYVPILPKRPDSIQNTKCYKSHYVTIHKQEAQGPVSLTCFRLQNYLKVFAISGTLF